MNDLGREISTLIIKIEQYCGLILLGKYNLASEYLPLITSSFSAVVPSIIKSYDENESLKDKDRSVWIDLLKRIISVVGTDDDFRKIDILRFELNECLRVYLDFLEN